jgi:hypothetical protein
VLARQQFCINVQTRGGFTLGTNERKQAVLWWRNPRADLKREAPETRTRYFDAYAHPAISPEHLAPELSGNAEAEARAFRLLAKARAHHSNGLECLLP